MTAYDVSEWADFAKTVAGGAAALAGLLFVGLSLNLAEVLKYPGVPARAAGHARAHHRHTADGDFRRDSRARPSGARRGDRRDRDLRSPGAGLYQREERSRARTMYLTLLPLVPAVLLIVGAVSLWLQRGGGLYWVTASVTTGFVAASANAWVLLVEIKR